MELCYLRHVERVETRLPRFTYAKVEHEDSLESKSVSQNILFALVNQLRQHAPEGGDRSQVADGRAQGSFQARHPSPR